MVLADLHVAPETLGRYHVPEAVHGGTCVDVGANVGSFIAAHGHRFDHVLYYEANPLVFQRCQERFGGDPGSSATTWPSPASRGSRAS